MFKPLVFQRNYNQKLDCSCFTTVRLHNQAVNQVGTTRLILPLDKHGSYSYNGKQYRNCGNALVREIKPIPLKDINTFISHLDSGLPPGDFQQLLRHMYPTQTAEHGHETLFDIMLMDYVVKNDVFQQYADKIIDIIQKKTA